MINLTLSKPFPKRVLGVKGTNRYCLRKVTVLTVVIKCSENAVVAICHTPMLNFLKRMRNVVIPVRKRISRSGSVVSKKLLLLLLLLAPLNLNHPLQKRENYQTQL